MRLAISGLILFGLVLHSVQASETGIFRNLMVGDSGGDIKTLQELLVKEGVYPEGRITGFFGSLTKRAVVRFQEKYMAEILTPVGLSRGSGFVGPSTRNKIKQLPTSGAEAAVSFSKTSPFQGEVVIVKFSNENKAIKSAIWDNVEVPFFNFQGANTLIVPVAPNKAAGFYTLRATLDNGEIFQKDIRVLEKNFPKVLLEQPEEAPVEQEELPAKLNEKKVDLGKVFGGKTESIFFSRSFGLPLYNNRNISTYFGTIYKSGGSEIRHLGVDFVGRIGTPVAAINDGYVRKAYLDSLYGNSVIIDHGQGIFSYYIHLNEIRVKEGDFVKIGKIIGTIGQTGYATAPHLHLSIKIAGVSIDPLSFISALR